MKCMEAQWQHSSFITSQIFNKIFAERLEPRRPMMLYILGCQTHLTKKRIPSKISERSMSFQFGNDWQTNGMGWTDKPWRWIKDRQILKAERSGVGTDINWITYTSSRTVVPLNTWPTSVLNFSACIPKNTFYGNNVTHTVNLTSKTAWKLRCFTIQL